MNMETKKIFYQGDFRLVETSDAGFGVPFKFTYYTANPKQSWVATFDGHEYTNCELDGDGNLCIGFDDHHLGVGTLMVERRYYLTDEHYQSGICDEVIEPTPVIIKEEEDGVEVEMNVVLGFDGCTAPTITGEIPPYYTKGDPGKSAYEIAVEHGYVGTEEEWLASLQGEPGKSAYQIAVEHGYRGTEQEWLSSLKGPQGDSAYEVAVQQGYVGTKDEWLASLVGPEGPEGPSGGMLFPTMSFNPETGILTVRGLQQEVQRISYNEETAELIIRL